MIARGVKIDKEYYETLYADYGKELEDMDKELETMTGIEGFSVDKETDVVNAFSKYGIVTGKPACLL